MLIIVGVVRWEWLVGGRGGGVACCKGPPDVSSGGRDSMEEDE